MSINSEQFYYAPCSYCGHSVAFQRIPIEGGPFWTAQPFDEKAGSDHLAAWCAGCGPKHRAKWRMNHERQDRT